MNENIPKNIFEAAGKQKKSLPSKKEASKEKKIAQPEKEIPSKVGKNSEKLLDLHKDPEVNEMLNKMYLMKEEIQVRLNEVYDKTGISSSQIKNFLNNPNNFPPELWQKIEGQREILEKKINAVLKIYGNKPKGTLSKISSQESRLRKSKTLGARKNWIPM